MRYNINPLPKEKYFFYQLEQFDKSNSPHIFNSFVFLIMKHAKHIFDYSNINLAYYNENQIENHEKANEYNLNMNDGWICEKCGNVNRPDKAECLSKNNT